MGAAVIAGIGTGITLISAIIRAAGAIQEGKANEEYNLNVARQFEAQAGAFGEQAHRDVLAFGDTVRGFTASQRAALAANGMIGTQTAMELLSDTERQAALDRLAIEHNANLRRWEAQAQAKLARQSGKNARYAGGMSAASSLIGTAGQVADQWYRWTQTSMGKGA